MLIGKVPNIVRETVLAVLIVTVIRSSVVWDITTMIYRGENIFLGLMEQADDRYESLRRVDHARPDPTTPCGDE
jgi:hypothetical protein